MNSTEEKTDTFILLEAQSMSDEFDPRVDYAIKARQEVSGETIQAVFGSHDWCERTAIPKEAVLVPFPHLKWRIRFRPNNFAVIRVMEPDRFSHWILGKIGSVYLPMHLQTETIFSHEFHSNKKTDS